MSKREQGFEYTGMDNLEVMLEAQNYNRFLTDQVIANRVAGGAILDFGAGIGTFAEMVQSRGIEVHCLEPDERQAALLHAKGFETFSSADDIAAASYDYIYSLNVFEHIEDDGTAVNQAYRILKPGGALYIYGLHTGQMRLCRLHRFFCHAGLQPQTRRRRSTQHFSNTFLRPFSVPA